MPTYNTIIDYDSGRYSYNQFASLIPIGISPVIGIGILFNSYQTGVERYLNLVTSEHSTKPNFMAWLSSTLSIVDDCTGCAYGINDALDLDNAIGIQLDLLGVIVGIPRVLPFQPTGGISPILDDDTYRLAIRACIAKNSWDGTIASIHDIWSILFKSSAIYLILHDNQDMTMTAIAFGMASTIQQDLINHGYLVPKPEGVQLAVATPPSIVFAYGIEFGQLGGYGEGSWIAYNIM